MSKNKPVVFDDDNPEWTKEDFARARPGREVLPPEVVANLEKMRKPGQRGPGKRPPKVPITFRLDPDIVERIKASGVGYGARVNDTLRKAFVLRSKEAHSSTAGKKLGGARRSIQSRRQNKKAG